eukprot:scaffold24636_cov64-Phaeocystis_antarctica.AAC.1
MSVHCIAARQHTKVVATVSGSCPPCPSIGVGGTELRQPDGREGAGRRVGGNVHARAGLLRDPDEDVKAARLGGGLLAQAEHILVEGCHRRHSHDRRAVGRGTACVHAVVLEEAREGDDRLVANSGLGRALGAVERRALLIRQHDALLYGEAAQEELERERHVRYMNAHPLAQARHGGPLAHPQTQLVHRATAARHCKLELQKPHRQPPAPARVPVVGERANLEVFAGCGGRPFGGGPVVRERGRAAVVPGAVAIRGDLRPRAEVRISRVDLDILREGCA